MVVRLRQAGAVALVLAAIGLAAVGVREAPAADARVSAAPRVTLIADSVGGALFWMGEARAVLARGLDLDLEIATCRKLDAPGCTYAGSQPVSAVEVARTRRAALGQVVVVAVGYNDLADPYAEGIDRLMRALLARGVERVVWVTLRETTQTYRSINAAIEQAARRWPALAVADWHGASKGHDDWFSDTVHLTIEGGVAFARFLRPRVLDACGVACGPDGTLLALAASKLGPARARTPFRGVLRVRGGTPPYRFAVQGLPRPLRVSSGGVVTGRPRVSGRYPLAVRVTDADGITNEGVVLLRIAPRG